MLAFLIAHWLVPAMAILVCAVYIRWKSKGGTILFKIKKSDDGATQALKAIFGFGWAYGSILLAVWISIFSAVWLFVAGVSALFGAG